jgi:replicative DNA helicase
MAFDLNELVEQVTQEEAEKLRVFGDARVEEGVISCCMARSSQFTIARTLVEPGDFSVAGCLSIYSTMCELYDSGLSIDPVTIASALRARGKLNSNSSAMVDRLWSLGADEIDLTSYCSIMREAARKRQCFALGLALQRMARSSVPSDNIASKAEETLRQITYGYGQGQQSSYKAGEIRDQLPGKDADILLPYGGQTGISTPLSSLNAKFDGFFRKTMVVLGARTSVGKTALACQIAVGAAKAGFPTRYISLEMSKEAILRRMVCPMVGIPRSELRDLKRDGVPDSLREKAREAIDTINALPLWISDRSPRNDAGLRREMEREKVLNSIVFTVVDHIQLLKTSRRGGGKTEELGEISGGLKATCMDLDMAMLVLSQIGRESVRRDDKRPQISDLYYSGSIEQDADAVILAHRPGLYDPKISLDQAELILGKQREGEVATIKEVRFDPDMCRFEDVDLSYRALPFNPGRAIPAAAFED